MPRKAAYFLSIRDSRRPELRGDELCAFTWERLRNDANVDLDYMERADPSEVLGDVGNAVNGGGVETLLPKDSQTRRAADGAKAVQRQARHLRMLRRRHLRKLQGMAL